MEELDLKEMFNIFGKRKIGMIAILLIVVIIGAIYSFYVVKPVYTSYTTALLKQKNIYLENGENINETNIASFVPTYIELVNSNVVKKEVADELELDGLNIGTIEVTQVTNTEMVKISVTHSDASSAKQVANKIVEVANKKIKEIYKIDDIYVIDEAEESTVPSNINHKKDIILFTLIGVVIACGYAIVRYMWNESNKK